MHRAPGQQVSEVAVTTDLALTSRPRLFAALETAFPILFRPLNRCAAPSAVLEINDALPGSTRELAAHGVPALSIGAPSLAGTVNVRLLGAPGLDQRLRNVTLAGQAFAAGIDVRAGDSVLATHGTAARWTASATDAPVHRVAATLPELRASTPLRNAIFGRDALAVIALVQFLRAVSRPCGWEAPPLRATFVFDDPNLRWRRYGFVDYPELLMHADLHRYHVAMAMVPADTGRAHRATVSLFRQRSDRLSLAIHGNNHVKRELVLPSDYESALAVCAQALRRMKAFQARTHLAVDRVMMPPHGLYSEPITQALGALGFDALCAIHPIPWSGGAARHQVLAGWDPATFSGATAVIPRFPLTASKTEIALRAFLDHPLVLYGHHQDLAEGLDPLADAARRVNSLGEVRWSSAGAIARSNYGARRDRDTLIVRPFAGRVRVEVPRDVTRLVVEGPRGSGGGLAGWSEAHHLRAFDDPTGCRAGSIVDIRLRANVAADPRDVAAPVWSPWPGVRRAATEARDRVMPLGSRRTTTIDAS